VDGPDVPNKSKMADGHHFENEKLQNALSMHDNQWRRYNFIH